MGVTAITLAVGLACGNGVGPDLGVRSVTVAPASATIRVRETVRLVANLDADAGVDLSVTWSSSDPAVAKTQKKSLHLCGDKRSPATGQASRDS